MKMLYKFIQGAFLVLISFNIQSQTVFELDTVTIDSGSVINYCIGQHTANISFSMWTNFSGYTQGDSVEATCFFGDGNSATKKFPIYGSSANNSAYGYFSHAYTTPGVYQAMVTVIAPDLKTDTKLSGNMANVAVCGNLSGQVYFDANNNCSKDAGEQEAKWTTVQVTNTSTSQQYIAYVNANGNYSINLPIGNTYDVVMSTTQFSQYCPAAGYSAVTVPSSNRDFGIVCGSGFDLTSIAWGGVRPGFTRYSSIRVLNTTCNPTSGTVKVTLTDPRVTYDATAWVPSWTSTPVVSGNTLTYTFTNASYYNNYYWNWPQTRISLPLKGDTTLVTGDTICFDVLVEPTSGDNVPSNNLKTYCVPVSNSYDPNDKIGLPMGIGPDKIIDRGQSIDYTIRFQNTGNDTAYKVVIIDTLPEELDLSTFRINGFSHDMDFHLGDDRVLKFVFEDIDLPDSTTNEPASQGSVNFTVDQVANLPYGTRIENTAGIFFDFNAPIITNTEFHTVDIIDGINEARRIEKDDFFLYPNPAANEFWIERASNELTLVKVYNALGEVMFEERTNQKRLQISTESLVGGMYFVELYSNSNRSIQKLIIKH